MGESPAVARRRLRLALRRAREEKGFTQTQVARALDWSLSKVQRIESGDVTISSTDLAACLLLLEISDDELVRQLNVAARAARKGSGWWDEPRYRESLPAAMMQLLQFEGDASEIRVFHPSLIPGLLQSRAYAESVLNFWSVELSDVDREIRLEVRLRRRQYVLERPDPPKYLLLLDESALWRGRGVAGPKVMAEQLRGLLTLARERRITARIVPMETGPLAMLNHFIVLDLPNDENAILYREAQLSDAIDQESTDRSLYRERFERFWSIALGEEDSARLIEDVAATLLSGGSYQTRLPVPNTRKKKHEQEPADLSQK